MWCVYIDISHFFHPCPEEYSPASFVEDFSNEVDGALSSVTHLDLVYRRMRASALSLEGMNDAMALLVSKSPALKCLTCDGQLDPVFLQKMGEACPLITELTLAGAGAQSTLLEDLQSFTAALPRLNSLIFPGLFTLPDISLFSKIRSLELNEYRINADTAWLCLPSNLQYIKCHRIGCGPPALASGRHVLESLICLEVCSERIPLNALAQLLREAPSLKAVCTGVLGGGVLVIVCDLNSSTKDDLIVLSHNNEVAGITNAIINMSSSRNMIEGPLEAFAHGMPSMSGFQRCVFECQGSNLLPMLAVFPDVSNLRLTFAELVDDTVLQALASSSRLTHLEMEFCHHVSPTGLLLLSQNLPALQIVGIGACELLNGPAFESCVEMLTSNGSHLKLVDVGGGVFDDLRRSVTAFSRFRWDVRIINCLVRRVLSSLAF